MTGADALAPLVWPLSAIGEAVVALAHGRGLAAAGAVASPPRHPPADPAMLDRWLAATGEQLGVAIEPITAAYREVDEALAVMHPVVVRLPDGALVVLRSRRGQLDCLGPDGAVHRVARRDVVRALKASHEAAHMPRIERLLAGTGLSSAARQRAEAGLLGEFLAKTTVLSAWLLRLPPGASFLAQARTAGLLRLAGALVAAHAAQYVLFIASWWAVGRGVLEGRLAPGWLWGWAVILLLSVPLIMLATWFQGKLAVGVGALLRRRLLAGALELPPAVLNRDGIGRLLGRTIEADTLERLVLSGGFTSVLSVMELCFAVPVLAAGAGGLWHAALLGLWTLVSGVLGVRLVRARQRWTDQRLALTGITVEHIVGHRTRLAQELPDRWHDVEDAALARYLGGLRAVDRRSLGLLVLVPRGWLLVGLAALAPAFIAGADVGALGAGIGGVVLAWMSLGRLAQGVDQLAGAQIAWRRVAPLFHAAAGRMPGDGAAAAGAARSSRPASPEYAIAHPAKPREPVLEVIDVVFRHDRGVADVLSGANLVIRQGDRVLIQGASGSGKSTLAGLLTGIAAPRSGLVLARGLDMSCLGQTGWRARVSAAPQFHENHVLTESFAFNLLMSRSWPPRPEDIQEARTICEELGLGPLLERMPGGMFQMIGETGWQLSHGEQSRLFIARALLQNSDVVVLDECLAALDPENMAAALRCVRARASSLVVIAHP